MNSILFFLTLTLSAPPAPNSVSTTGTTTPRTISASTAHAPIVQTEKEHKGLMARNPKLFTTAAFLSIPFFTVTLGMQMWKWGDTTHFKANSDGWFSANTTHGGADKTGHAFAFYWGSKLWTTYFEQIYPENKWKAALYGATIATLGGIAVEIGDGFATNYGFSYPDIIADMFGVLLALAQARWPAVDNLIDFSTTLVFTDGFLSSYNKNRFDVATDYSGQLITLNLRLGGIPLIKETILRYFRLDLGYFTRCYGSYDACSKERTGTDYWESRNLYVGFSLDLARMIDDHGSRSTFSRAVRSFSRYYNIWGLTPMGVNIDLDHTNRVKFGTTTIAP